MPTCEFSYMMLMCTVLYKLGYLSFMVENASAVSESKWFKSTFSSGLSGVESSLVGVQIGLLNLLEWLDVL